MSFLGGLNDVLKNYAITGNTLLDTIILANIIPIVIAYITTVFELLKNNVTMVSEYVLKLLYSKIKNKFAGEILCDVYISKNSPVFVPLKNIICNENIHELEIRGNITKNILNIINSNNYMQKYAKYYGEYYKDNRYFLHINRQNNNFVLDSNYYAEDEKIKIFQKDNLYFIFKYVQEIKETKDSKDTKESSNSNNSIDRIELKIIKFTNEKYDKIEISELFNYFLKNDLKIESNVVYTNVLSGNEKIFTDTVNRIFKNIDMDNNKFNLGNNVFENLENVNVYNDNHNFEVSFGLNQLNETVTNIKDNIKLKTSKIIEKKNGFFNLYNKYVGNGNHLGGSIGYFFDDNMIFFLSDSPYEITIVSKGKLLTEDLIKEKLEFLIKESFKNKKNQEISKSKSCIKLFTYDYKSKDWTGNIIDPRGFDTIYLPEKTIGEVINEINNFVRQSKLYKLCSIPYKKGLLFYGPPGTGKTSFAKAIAYEYQMNIYMINLNSEEVNDESIHSILNSMGSLNNKILLFEDVDTAFADKEQIKMESKINIEVGENTEQKKNQPQIKFLTYSGLLNALDGVMTNHQGVITIMTTNYIEKLGPALIRPGRIDNKFLLKECNSEQITKMCKSIITKYLSIIDEMGGNKDNDVIESEKYKNYDFLNGKIEEFAKKLVDINGDSKICPSKLQVYILRHIKNINNIFNNYEELLQC